MTPVVEMRNVSAGYGQIDVLHGIDLSLSQGTVLAVLGPNGAGKSTTVRALAGLVRPTNGQILLQGRDVTGASPDGLARAGLCVIPEGRGVFPRLTVDEHLRLVARDRAGTAVARERAYAHFPKLAQRRKQLAGTMSGGEQQMLALARAVAGDPAVVVIDELSMGLAPLIVEQLYEQVRSLAAAGISLILIEQFAHDVLGVADHAVVLQHGRIVRSGTPGEVAADLAEFYLARDR
ncbi:ABC transporter ATP-binding protein [Frankia sp. CNm7]|uniref:ABC transporter ATP-binding protein n=1 Tax=Frankia nepalensis TaxID=1836974 RepID=A0A937UVJ0_9ACTN|nr:ABC transporter ATP-binding protein [Frankia nepalensis]MBL7495070.1 ABC transporter ATP-binding protein [Frankia nepalensis]MBL7515328.1 ABC transporter ATP-binding protein [Frankia nepalensis]MBL7522315.1 ABC transporter ATP-binding protein [Frankia nepalensis]MBL7632311.1 ABC transporter ATP-binding protein [Frankia nepalensis]